MSFTESVRLFVAKAEKNSAKVSVNTASHVYESIVNGSPVTGAPGQPVDTGNLRNSWQLTFDSPSGAMVATNVEYAPYVEDNVRGVTFHNHGPHSVKMTIAGLPRIVEYETLKAQSGGSNG